MRFRNADSPSLAMIVVSICTLASLFVFQYKVRRFYASVKQKPVRQEEQFVAKYAPLGSLLPADEVAGFMIDRQHTNPKGLGEEGRWYLAQYAVSPRLVMRRTDASWVVVDSDRPDATPEIAVANRWTLVADFRNGLRLYQTNRK